MRTPFEFGVFARAAVIGLVLPIVATAIPVWRGLRLTPVEAIRVGFRSARGSGAAALAKRLRLPGSSVAQMPLRNALRAPRRTLMTVLGIGAVLSVLVAFMGLIDSFVATVDRSEAEVAQGNPDRIVVSLDGFQRARTATRVVATAPGVAASEPQLTLPARLSAPGADGFQGSVTLLDFSGPIWAPTIASGAHAGARPSRNRDLRKGGERPRRRGRRPDRDLLPAAPGIRLHRGERQGAGERPAPRPVPHLRLHGSLCCRIRRVPGRRQPGLGHPGAGGARRSDCTCALSHPSVASVERATAATQFVRERLDDFIGVLRVIEGFALALALLIAFNSSAISIDERRRENATMLAFGVTSAKAMVLAVVREPDRRGARHSRRPRRRLPRRQLGRRPDASRNPSRSWFGDRDRSGLAAGSRRGRGRLGLRGAAAERPSDPSNGRAFDAARYGVTTRGLSADHRVELAQPHRRRRPVDERVSHSAADRGTEQGDRGGAARASHQGGRATDPARPRTRRARRAGRAPRRPPHRARPHPRAPSRRPGPGTEASGAPRRRARSAPVAPALHRRAVIEPMAEDVGGRGRTDNWRQRVGEVRGGRSSSAGSASQRQATYQ